MIVFLSEPGARTSHLYFLSSTCRVLHDGCLFLKVISKLLPVFLCHRSCTTQERSFLPCILSALPMFVAPVRGNNYKPPEMLQGSFDQQKNYANTGTGSHNDQECTC